MPSKATQTRFRVLQRRFADLKAEFEHVARAHSTLLLQQNLLDGLCEAFSLLQANATAQLILEDRDLSQERHQEFLQREAAVEQLTAGCPSRVVAHNQNHQNGVNTVAPRSDPLAYFKTIVCKPRVAAAATMTPADLAGVMRSAVLEASVHLHIVQNFPSSQQDSTETLERIWTRYMHNAASLVMCGRQEVVEALNFYNLDTLEQDEQAPHKLAEQLAMLPSLLNLTVAQVEEITQGTSVFMGMLKNVLAEQQQLQAKIGGTPTPATTRRSECGSTSSAGGGTAALCPMMPDSRLKRLEADLRDIERMRVLLQKEYYLKAAACGWFMGALTWEQWSKASIMSWPYVVRPTLLIQKIAQHAQTMAA